MENFFENFFAVFRALFRDRIPRFIGAKGVDIFMRRDVEWKLIRESFKDATVTRQDKTRQDKSDGVNFFVNPFLTKSQNFSQSADARVSRSGADALRAFIWL